MANISQDHLEKIGPGITPITQDLIFKGNGTHDNCVLRGDGPCSRLVLYNDARIIFRDIDRWEIADLQIIKAGGSTAIDHMLVLENCTWGQAHHLFLDGFGLAAGMLLRECGGNMLDHLTILDVTGTSSDVRGIGLCFDQRPGNLDNKTDTIITHPASNAVGDSMVAILGNTAGFFLDHLDCNPAPNMWTLDIDGDSGIHRESQITNVGTALATGSRGAIRVVNAEHIALGFVIVEGNGAIIDDHLVHLDCLGGKCIGWSFNNIHTTADHHFFYQHPANVMQFVANIATRCTKSGVGEFISGGGLDEFGNRFL